MSAIKDSFIILLCRTEVNRESTFFNCKQYIFNCQDFYYFLFFFFITSINSLISKFKNKIAAYIYIIEILLYGVNNLWPKLIL